MISGVLRGFDPYMNIVMDDTVEERSHSQKINIGMVVSMEQGRTELLHCKCHVRRDIAVAVYDKH